MSAKFSEAQRHVLILLNEGELHRWNGGWWALPGEPYDISPHDGYKVPRRSAAWQTIKSMQNKGLIEATETDLPDWTAPRRLTDEGMKLSTEMGIIKA